MAEEAGQKSTNSEKPVYVPTKKEEALLEVILNPQNRHKNVEELCRLVPCDKKTYYAAFKKPEFCQLYRDESINLTKMAVGHVVNAVVREAIRGSHQHAKIVLGMADVYHERKEVTGKGGGPVAFSVENLLDEIDGKTKDLVKS